jgi:two-component system nitrogen regulation sensor histidine kinase NtrY
MLHATAERDGEGQAVGIVLTFDDVTALLSAQRTAAWSDVARRIAHEIKNPLTPIYLAAERIRRKYVAVHADDTTLVRYLDTITRHVTDIGHMVDAFANFARLPAPKLARVDLATIERDAVFSLQCAQPEWAWQLHIPNTALWCMADSTQMTQVCTNILKNAGESLHTRPDPQSVGTITVILAALTDALQLRIMDNGNGFPPELLGRLTEPYVTTRAKGTGLGLAIVKKIVEDHQGTLALANRTDGVQGAVVTITLPMLGENASLALAAVPCSL